MQKIQGKGVSDGIAEGRLYFYEKQKNVIPFQKAADPEIEKRRLKQAQEESCMQLEQLAEECGSGDMAELFRVHGMLAADPEFSDRISEVLERETCSAEYAVWLGGETYAQEFVNMEDPYLQARAADVRDVTRRILNNLTGNAADVPAFKEPVIFAADDLTPSETLRLDKTMIQAFVTRRGSEYSHAAILARSMEIPAICGLGEALEPADTGVLCCLDGGSGELILEPDPGTRYEYQKKYLKQREQKILLERLKGKADVTLDGHRILLDCNIGSLEDIEAVRKNDGGGIGLFRSEFLYLRSNHYPSEEEQFQTYAKVAEAMEGKRVVIRTLDVGADKQQSYFQMKPEENPALGQRAIRLCLNRPEMFKTQLRAIFRASAHGNVAVMFPMIISVWEVRECRRLCGEVMTELRKEGKSFDEKLEIGIMIETPSAVLMAEELAKEADFLSIGTNDLAQYILACDRQSGEVERFFDPKHPAVLRAIQMTAGAAHRAGIRVGICGELGADISLLPLFVRMGIDELSVAPAAVLPLRARIREMNTGFIE